jgi:hypothetical protein
VINEWKNSVRLIMYYATKYFSHNFFFVFVPAGHEVGKKPGHSIGCPSGAKEFACRAFKLVAV